MVYGIGFQQGALVCNTVALCLIAIDAKIEDAFYRDLAFGTGGLRGVIGAGTNRMNIYTVAKASQGLADYLQKNFAEPSVAIGYDSRIDNICTFCAKALFLELCVYYKTLAGKLHPRTC